MKIINNTNGTLHYLVTPSGTTLSGSKIIASGTIWANTAREFGVTGAGDGPNVYFKAESQNSQGYVFRQAANANSVLKLEITEE